METQKFKLKAAAKKIGISYATLRLRVKQGLIGVESLGPKTNYIYLAEIEAYKRRHQFNFTA